MMGFDIKKKLHQVRIILGCKKDTNPPALFGDVGFGSWSRVGAELTKRWQIGTNGRLFT